MAASTFGTLEDGTEIEEVTIADGDLSLRIITYGAIIRDVRLAGIDHPLVLGFDSLDDYVRHSPHCGAVAGRSANRIGGGRLTIDGIPYQLTRNEGGLNHLHGGNNGFGKRPWRLVEHTPASVTLALSAKDGEDGYPGNVETRLRYIVEAPGTLRMEAEAVTDAPTVVNLAQHTYFNLDNSPDILDHEAQIFADAYTPTDAGKIPTGEIRPVDGSDYDFREMRAIRRMSDGKRVEYDLNFVVGMEKAKAPRPAARLESKKSGVRLDVSSTEPGVQFYDGCMMNVTVPGLGGKTYPLNGGCCFEPGFFPDAPNHPNFASSVLRPGDTYRQTTLFAFSRRT